MDLSELAQKTIEELKDLPQPIVRVCGPLTTGGLGYEENAKRLSRAEEILSERGESVFRFGDSEAHIQGKGYEYSAIMEEFHKPILESGLISKAYFLPNWKESKGATWEHDFITNSTRIEIEEFPEELLK